MKEISKPDGSVYCWVEVSDGLLRIKMNTGSAKGCTVNLDEKIVPQLISILKEIENDTLHQYR
jgi:hypothetical protein